MNKFFKIIFLFISVIFCFNVNNVFADNGIGLSTYGIDLLHPDRSVTDDTSQNTAASFLGGGVANIINIIMGFSALVVFVLVIYGGIVVLFSNGNPSSYKTGLNIIKTTFIGLIIISFSYAVVRFVVMNIFNISNV